MSKLILCRSKNGTVYTRTQGERRLKMWKKERKIVDGVDYERYVNFKPHPSKRRRKVVESRTEWVRVSNLDHLWGDAPVRQTRIV
jgi:hypothetical protein